MQAPVWPKRIIIPEHIELNVGGKLFKTTKRTLSKEKYSLLATLFSGRVQLQKDSRGKYFIDRDGALFAYILDYLRKGTLSLPEGFVEYARLAEEAEFYKLTSLIKAIQEECKGVSMLSNTAMSLPWIGKESIVKVNRSCPNLSTYTSPSLHRKSLNHRKRETVNKSQANGGDFISINIQTTYGPSGREHMDTVWFRKIPRLLVAGHVAVLRSVFQDDLNTSRCTDPENDRYTCRYYLAHNNINQVFERLHECDFHLVSSCAGKTGQIKSSEDSKWDHFISYVFFREGT